MILWINGAFGSGKTQTAWELHRRLESSFVYDPESVGYWLRKNEPRRLQAENFQDETLWRAFNRMMLEHLDQPDQILIVPMTLLNLDYYEEIITALRKQGISVVHYVLSTSEATLRKRLRKRLEREQAWSVQMIPVCLKALKDPRLENKLVTDHLSIPECAELIAERTGLTLKPRCGKLRQKLYEIRTQCHVFRLPS